jgi:phospholipid/cholesterol/gamma-HCH transport system permease protein
MALPTLSNREPAVRRHEGVCYLAGNWTVHALAARGEVAARRKALPAPADDVKWDLQGIERLDTAGACLIWRAWGGRLPPGVNLPPSQRGLFEGLARDPPADHEPPGREGSRLDWIHALGQGVIGGLENGRALLILLGQLMLDVLGLIAWRWRAPWTQISAQIYRTGAQALGITALVGFLIGIVLSYLSAQQLRLFGADRFIVQVLGVSIVRELGPVLAAILVAGRSGSAITAQIGVMRVTQELDAMRVMGLALGQRLVVPRVLALCVAMPLLVLWTDALALLGGMMAAEMQLGLPMAWFFQSLPNAISLANFFIGLLKGATFGLVIALVACHFGLRIKANTESLGRGTTASVVTSITGVILVDALYAILFSRVGI